MIERVRNITPLQWYIAGGLLSFIGQAVKRFNEAAYLVIIAIAVVFCINGIVKYSRS